MEPNNADEIKTQDNEVEDKGKDQSPSIVEVDPQKLLETFELDRILRLMDKQDNLINIELDNLPLLDRQFIQQRQVIFDLLTEKITIGRAKEAALRLQNMTPGLLPAQSNLTYGEITFRTLAEIFFILKSRLYELLFDGGKFYDLGSGSGKVVLGAAILHNFDECIGIEIAEPLYELSRELEAAYKEYQDDENDDQTTCQAKVLFELDDIKQYDWTDGDVIFMNSTCFDAPLMQAISKQAEALKPGSLVITTTHRLTDLTYFKVLENFRRKMSWGDSTIIIHQRIETQEEE